MPAKSPFVREYDSISAVILASVPAPAVRPTGPAATDASAPRVTLFSQQLVHAVPVHHEEHEVRRFDSDLEPCAAF